MGSPPLRFAMLTGAASFVERMSRHSLQRSLVFWQGGH